MPTFLASFHTDLIGETVLLDTAALKERAFQGYKNMDKFVIKGAYLGDFGKLQLIIVSSATGKIFTVNQDQVIVKVHPSVTENKS